MTAPYLVVVYHIDSDEDEKWVKVCPDWPLAPEEGDIVVIPSRVGGTLLGKHQFRVRSRELEMAEPRSIYGRGFLTVRAHLEFLTRVDGQPLGSYLLTSMAFVPAEEGKQP